MIMILILLLALVGFAVSFYGLMVERKLKKDPTYKPACDLSDRASCSKPMLSKYSHLFGVTNTVLGMAYYGILFAAAMLGLAKLVLLLAVAGCIASFGFAYILYFKIKSFCLICTTTYVINIALAVISFWYL